MTRGSDWEGNERGCVKCDRFVDNDDLNKEGFCPECAGEEKESEM